MDTDILEFLKAELEAARGTWPEIAKATGVPYFTITNLIQGKVEDPRLSTVQPLVDYFQSLPKARKPKAAA